MNEPLSFLLCCEFTTKLWWYLSGLQNDHKAIMVEIEEALHKLHAREKAKRDQDEAEAQVEAMEEQVTLPPPFARVDAVTEGSPAYGAVSDTNFSFYWWCCFRKIFSSLVFLPAAVVINCFLLKGTQSWGWNHRVWVCELRELSEPPEYRFCGATQWEGKIQM